MLYVFLTLATVYVLRLRVGSAIGPESIFGGSFLAPGFGKAVPSGNPSSVKNVPGILAPVGLKICSRIIDIGCARGCGAVALDKLCLGTQLSPRAGAV